MWGDLINRWLHRGLTTLAGVLQAVRELLAGLFSTLETTFGRWAYAFWVLTTSFWHLLNWLIALAEVLPWFLVWVLVYWVPWFVWTKTQAVIEWARWWVDVVRSEVWQWVQAAKNWAWTQVAWLRDLAWSWVDWLRNWLAETWAQLQWVLKQVHDFLTDPRILADWLIDAVMHAMFRWAEYNADRFTRWFLRMGVRAALTGANFVEGVIARVI
jgi:hypothetical protein